MFLEYVGNVASQHFNDDNRMGIDGTLHSIVAIKDRRAARNVVGLTYRIGRHVPGKCILLSAVTQSQLLMATTSTVYTRNGNSNITTSMIPIVMSWVRGKFCLCRAVI